MTTILLLSCGRSTNLKSFQGNWESAQEEVTLRWEPRPWRYLYYMGKVELNLQIENESIHGYFGESPLSELTILSVKPGNGIRPAELEFTAVVNQIFPNDPIPKKELTFLLRLQKDGPLKSGIWLTNYGSEFKVGNLSLSRVE